MHHSIINKQKDIRILLKLLILWFCVCSNSLIAQNISEATSASDASKEAFLLSEKKSDFEPSLAVGPNQDVYITAGRLEQLKDTTYFKSGSEKYPLTYKQQIVMWCSDNGGSSFKEPKVISDKDEFVLQGDQRVVVDDQGTAYLSWLEATLSEEEELVPHLKLATITDQCQSFDIQTIVDPDTTGGKARISDKPELSVSDNGRDIYIVFETGSGPHLAASHDSGQTWVTNRIAPSEGRHYWPTDIVQAPNGTIWFSASVSYQESLRDTLSQGSLHVFRSTDQGKTWNDLQISVSPRILDWCANGRSCDFHNDSIDLAVDDHNRVYVVYTQGKAYEPYRMYMQMSKDNGATWSPPQLLSKATNEFTGNYAHVTHVHVAAQGKGNFYVYWADDRKGQMLNTWAKYSSNGGQSWTDPVRLSTPKYIHKLSYKTQKGFKSFYGHYGGIGIDDDGHLHTVWGESEDRTRAAMQNGDIWYRKWNGKENE